MNTSDPYEIDGISTQLNLNGKSWQASHEYLALDYFRENLTTPVTNGDLHTLQTGFKKDINYAAANNLNWGILPTLAVSSNQLKNPDKIKSSSFRLEGHLAWQLRLQNKISIFAGACATAVTGDYELIPLAGIEYQYSHWGMTIAYPKTRLEYLINPGLTVFSSWELAGNQWQVLDKNLQNRNDVHLASKQIKLGFRVNIISSGMIDAYWIHHYDQEIEYLARNNSLVSTTMDNTNGWMLRYTHLMQ
ncbi:MAG: hypothetical protein ACN4GM_14210 [Gammaproteobacteria bacterium]